MRTIGKKEWIAIAVALIVAIALFYGGAIWNYLTGNDGTEKDASSIAADKQQVNPNASVNISTTKGVEIYDEQIGTGAQAAQGTIAIVHYVGTLADGSKFDSSIDRGKPFIFPVGGGQVIRGWDVGIVGMKVGGVRKLIIAPEFAYGPNAFGPIPANSTLTFQIQLMAVESPDGAPVAPAAN